MKYHARRATAAASIVLAAGSLALAGPGDRLVIIADPTNAESLHAANHYANARHVPAANVLYMEPGATDFAEFTATNAPALIGSLEQRAIADHIDFVLVMPGGSFYVNAPGLVNDGCSPVGRFSVASCYTMAAIADDVAAGGNAFSRKNNYFVAPVSPLAFDGAATWLDGAASADASAERLFISGMLGYTGPEGNTFQELLDLVDRSASADGTRPAGTFYYMNNPAQPPRNVRQPLYPSMVTELTNLGASAVQLTGEVPGGNHDCLGVMTGASNPNIGGGWSVLPGTFGDHLTSWAATFDITNQRKVSEWITKGCSASFGTVEEPCNYLGKFPRPTVHPIYFQGTTLGEAVFRGLQYLPFQGLFYGDPLTRAFAHIPNVNVTDAPGAPVSATIILTPSATTSHPTASIASYDLLVDGIHHDSTSFGSTLSLDTTTLCDGSHDVVVIAYDDTAAMTDGRWRGTIDVDNNGLAASLAVSPMTGDETTSFQCTVGASGGTISELRLWHNGRIVGTSSGAGTINVHGRLLGAGPVTLKCEAVFADGSCAFSQPIDLTVNAGGGAPSGNPPTAFGYSRDVSSEFPFLLELPSTFDDALAGATWSVISGPSQSTVRPGTGPYRVLVPNPNFEGADSLTFRVTTPSGQSTIETIDLNMVRTACLVDVGPPAGTIDFFDLLSYLFLFDSGDPAADLAPPYGSLDTFDILEFLTLFDEGCD